MRRANDSVAREIEKPRQHKRDRKAENNCDDDSTHGPVWNVKHGKNLSYALGQGPTCDDVGNRHAVNFSAFQLREKSVHGFAFTNFWKRGSFRIGSHSHRYFKSFTVIL